MVIKIKRDEKSEILIDLKLMAKQLNSIYKILMSEYEGNFDEDC